MELHKRTNERSGHHSSITHVHLIFLKKLCSSAVFAVSFTFSLFIEWGDAEKFWLFYNNYMDNQLIFLSVIITPYSLWIKNPVVITARKRSLKQGNVFTGVCLSTGAGVGFPACITGHTTSIRWGGGAVGFPACITGHMTSIWGCLHPGGLHLGCMPTGELGGSASREVYLQGGVGQTPLPELKKQAVPILLECFLVWSIKNNSRVALT